MEHSHFCKHFIQFHKRSILGPIVYVPAGIHLLTPWHVLADNTGTCYLTRNLQLDWVSLWSPFCSVWMRSKSGCLIIFFNLMKENLR